MLEKTRIFLDPHPEVDDFQNFLLISSFLSRDMSLAKFSCRSAEKFLRAAANKQTALGEITALAEVMIKTNTDQGIILSPAKTDAPSASHATVSICSTDNYVHEVPIYRCCITKK